MGDRKSNVSSSSMAVGVAAVATVGGLLYYLLKQKNPDQVNNYGYDDRRNNQSPSTQRYASIREVPPRINEHRATPTAELSANSANSNRSVPAIPTNTNSVSTEERDNIDICIICCVPLSTEEESASMPIKLPCNHYFHMGCIMNWIRETRQCPLCDARIPDDFKIEHLNVATDAN